MQMSSESSNDCYSTDQQYFIDLCRGGQYQQIQQFIMTLSQQSKFNWQWTTNSKDNFIHMLAANNFPQIFDYIMNFIKGGLQQQKISQLINGQNSTGNTPLHYAVITDSKQMVIKLLQFKADTSITNQFGRTAFDQAFQFDKNQIAEILAPLTKQDIEKLKQQFGSLQICNQDSSSEQEEQDIKIKKQKQQVISIDKRQITQKKQEQNLKKQELKESNSFSEYSETKGIIFQKEGIKQK